MTFCFWNCVAPFDDEERRRKSSLKTPPIINLIPATPSIHQRTGSDYSPCEAHEFSGMMSKEHVVEDVIHQSPTPTSRVSPAAMDWTRRISSFLTSNKTPQNPQQPNSDGTGTVYLARHYDCPNDPFESRIDTASTVELGPLCWLSEDGNETSKGNENNRASSFHKEREQSQDQSHATDLSAESKNFQEQARIQESDKCLSNSTDRYSGDSCASEESQAVSDTPTHVDPEASL
nr:hypothetical protein L203_04547 [Cryptococcus depauperatus CBS 7841]